MKKFKSLITEFSQEPEVIHTFEGPFTSGNFVRVGIEDVEFSSGQSLDKWEFLGKEVTIIIGDSESEVPKQELPVVPTWFDEWWKDIPKGGGNLFYNIGRFQDELFSFETREAYDYITDPDNKKKLLDIIVNELEYEVEEEPLYHALIKGHELMVDKGDWTFKYWKSDTSNGRVFPSHRLINHDDFLTEISKEDWNELGINDSNADFVKVDK